MSGPSPAPAMDSPADPNWYDEAEWYDIAFGWDTADEIAALRRIFAEFSARPVRRVYEPFCGSGRLSIPLARAGFDVVGADLNAAMIALAARKGAGASASHHLADVRAWSPPGEINAVVTLIDSFRHISDEGDARGLLTRWGRLVGRGGVVVVGLSLDDATGSEGPPAEWTASRDGVEVRARVGSAPCAEPGLSIMVAAMSVTLPDGSTRSVESRQPLRRYTLESFGGLAEEAGLEVRRVTAWSSLREDRPAVSGQVVVTLTAR